MSGKRCLECGGERLVAGAVVWNAPVRFKREGAGSFNRGTEVKASACRDCGHVDLYLETPPG